MRAYGISMALVAMLAAVPPASAIENYISTGHPYAPGSDHLPPLNSEQDQINKQTDLIEADIYTKQRERKIFDSDLSRFINNQELTGPDRSALDY